MRICFYPPSMERLREWGWWFFSFNAHTNEVQDHIEPIEDEL